MYPMWLHTDYVPDMASCGITILLKYRSIVACIQSLTVDDKEYILYRESEVVRITHVLKKWVSTVKSLSISPSLCHE